MTKKHLSVRGQKHLTRRQMIKSIGKGTLAATVGAAVSDLFISTGSATQFAQSQAIARRVNAFDLEDVRLLDGPFRRAQELNSKYLLQLEPDRLLHNFRVNAGLKPKAPVYGGWESVEPWIDIRCHGHTLGHYLTACSLTFASTGDDKFKQKVDYCISELSECQVAGKTGLICAFPDGQAPLDHILNPTRFVGVPWYTMHKIFAGLRDAYLYARNREALKVLVELSDWAIAHTQNLTDAQFQKMLSTEHGGMNEVLADVHTLTGEPRFLTLAKRFCHHALLDPLSQEKDTLDGLHSNTQIPKVIGFNRIYEVTGDSTLRTASRFFWSTVVNRRTFATGGNGDREHFFPPAEFFRRLGSAKTMETCCTHNMLKLTRGLFMLDPSDEYPEYYERALYNSILASQDPDSGMMMYFQPTRPGYLKLYCTPTDSFWCCTGSGIENHAKYGDSIYFHDEHSLYVNLFISSTLKWEQKGVTLTQTTRFPEIGATQFRVETPKPVKFRINVRHPVWSPTASISINGRKWKSDGLPGRYVTINRVWRNGDKLELDLPMSIRSEALPGRPDIVALMYGPIVLAGRLGRKGIAPGSDIIVNERTSGDMLNEPVAVPKLLGSPDEIVRRINRLSGSSLVFRTDRIGDPHDVELVPYFRIAHERFNLYWNTSPRP